MNLKRLTALVCTLLFYFSSTLVFAQDSNEVIVKDSSGFVRAQTVVDGKGKVEFTVVDDKGDRKDGAVLVLLNNATGESLSGVSASGLTVFEGVTPGIWTISTTTPGVVFTNVAITSLAGAGAAGAGAGVTGASLLALGGIAAGGTAIGVGVFGGSNDNGVVISPSS